VGFQAGVAYSSKTLSTNVGDGDYVHIGFYHWFANDYDFTTPSALANSGYIRCLGLYDSVSGKRLGFRVEATAGGTTGRKWTIACTAGTATPAPSDIFDPSWDHGTWRWIDMYAYIHNTAGWMQLWEGGTKWAEDQGIDTLPPGDYDELRVGINYRETTDDDACFVFDHIVVDDCASPSAPA